MADNNQLRRPDHLLPPPAPIPLVFQAPLVFRDQSAQVQPVLYDTMALFLGLQDRQRPLDLPLGALGQQGFLLMNYENQEGMPLQVYTPRQSVGHVLECHDLKFENSHGQTYFVRGLHSIAYFEDKAKLLRGVGWVIEHGELKNLSIMYLPVHINVGKHRVTIGEILQLLMNKVKEQFPTGPALQAGEDLPALVLGKHVLTPTKSFHGTVNHLLGLCEGIVGGGIRTTYY